MIRIFKTKDAKEWNELLSQLPIEQQDVYFTPEYYGLYEAYGDGEAICFVYQDREKIALYPFMKNSVNKLGYCLDGEYYDIQGAYGYNGVVTNCKDGDFMADFWKAFDAYCN